MSDATLRYTVDAQEQRLAVEITSDGPLTGRWRFRRGHGVVERVQADGRELDVEEGAFELAGARRLTYVYDLHEAKDRFGGNFRTGIGDGSTWLLDGQAYLARPAKVQRSCPVEVRFTGAVPLTPQPIEDGVLRLKGRDLLDPGFHTYGGWAATVEIGARELHVRRLSGWLRVEDTDVLAWIHQAARELLTVRPDLPHPTLNVTVVPSYGSGVQFGQVLFSRPPSVAIYLGDRATRRDLREDWVAVHELSHTLVPSFWPRCQYLSEGLATYYQEVARARSGRRSARSVWAAFRTGLRNGLAEADGRSLRELSDRMHQTHAYRAVYWGGAFVALALDVELRRLTNGTRCLDDVLAALHASGPSLGGGLRPRGGRRRRHSDLRSDRRRAPAGRRARARSSAARAPRGRQQVRRANAAQRSASGHPPGALTRTTPAAYQSHVGEVSRACLVIMLWL